MAQLPVMNDEYAVTNKFDFRQDVRGEHNGLAPVSLLAEKFQHTTSRQDVESRGGFIEDDELAVSYESGDCA